MKKLRPTIWERSGGVCFYCGGSIQEDAFIVEHMVPLCRGGSNEQTNLVAACDSCDVLKGGMTADEFMYQMDPEAAYRRVFKYLIP